MKKSIKLINALFFIFLFTASITVFADSFSYRLTGGKLTAGTRTSGSTVQYTNVSPDSSNGTYYTQAVLSINGGPTYRNTSTTSVDAFAYTTSSHTHSGTALPNFK